jgi:methylmalonyl-CoA/ethylmalonyl-CoA epimerase
MKLHHFGFATKSIERSSQAYHTLGYEIVSDVIIDPVQRVRLQFLEAPGFPLLELVEPLSGDSPVSTILRKYGCSLYHSCYEVNDIRMKINELRKEDFLVIIKPVEAIAFKNLIAFLYHSETGLIELLQK